MITLPIEDVYESRIMGMKAFNLKEISNLLKEKRVTIPRSLVITTQVYEDCVKSNGIDEKKFEETYLDELYEEVRVFFNNKKVVVRSSSTLEDSCAFSLSGVYDSFINVDSKEKFFKAIIDCYKSNSKDISKITNFNPLRTVNGKMAILVQEMITDLDQIGVAFSRNPINGSDEIIVESSKSNSGVVSGRGDVKRNVFKDAGVHTEYAILNDVVLFLKEKLGIDVDVEWGVKDGCVYIFQCRKMFYSELNDVPFSNLPSPTLIGVGVSPGVAFGKFSFSKYSSVSFLNDYDEFFTNIQQINAAITSEGGILSHQANLMRENLIPAVKIDLADKEALRVYSGYVIVDGFRGNVYLYDNYNEEEKKELINAYLKYLKNNRTIQKKMKILSINYINQKEAVFMQFDRALQTKINQLNPVKKIFHQKIYSCDLIQNNLFGNPLFDCLRIQDDETTRIQFKQILINEDEYREENQIVINFKNISAAKKFMNKLGIEITEVQEREIDRSIIDGVNLNVIYWPNSDPYLGIEFQKEEEFIKIVNKLEVNFTPEALTGEQIFNKLLLNKQI